MGQVYYSRTLPDLVRQIERLAEAVERVVEQEQSDEPPTT